jgi:hypothetical protein
LLGEVAEAAEHLCHSLATRHLRLVELACPALSGSSGWPSSTSSISESEELSSSSLSSSSSCGGSLSPPRGGGTGPCFGGEVVLTLTLVVIPSYGVSCWLVSPGLS